MSRATVNCLHTGGLVLLCTLAGTSAAIANDFNDRGNIVIADQFNNRVIEIDPATHQIVWHFGNGSDQPGLHSVVGVNDAERFGPFTLISGTGIPMSDPKAPLPGCSTPKTGCPDNRVFIVDEDGEIIWQYGQAGVTGHDFNELNTPVHAVVLTDFPKHPGIHVLITDQGNQRVILVSLKYQIVWQYGMTGVIGNGANLLNNPNSAELLSNGHILIADENNDQVIEVDVNRNPVHTFTAGGTVSGAAFASRLPNGHTLITDSNHNRIVEVDRHDHVVWEYLTDTDLASQPAIDPAPLPTRAVRLRNGNTLISDQFSNLVIEVTPAKHTVFKQGKSEVAGNTFNRLNGPYDAKVVGDYTGLTPPPFEADEE